MTDVMREMIAQLMGSEREAEEGRRLVPFDHPSVCRAYLIGCCPYELVADSRLQNLVFCRKMHEPAHKADYERAQKEKDYFFDVEAYEDIGNAIRAVDAEIARVRDKLERDAKDKCEGHNYALTQSITEIDAKIETALQEMEELGKQGRIDESLSMSKSVEELRARREELEQQQLETFEAGSGLPKGFTALKVCEECSAQLNIMDAESRIADHFNGKMHLGMVECRSKYTEMKETIDERRRLRDATLYGRRFIRRTPERSRFADSPERERRRDRSRSRDRDRRSRSRDRERRRRRSRSRSRSREHKSSRDSKDRKDDSEFTHLAMTLKGLNSHHLQDGESEPAPLAAGKARLYNMKFCPFAERVVIYLARKGIETEIVNIDLQKKPEWYFKKHYQGKVPTFEHDGKVVIESLMVPEYLDDAFPNTPRILPADPFQKVQHKLLVERLAVVTQAFFGIAISLKENKLSDEKIEAAKKAFAEAESLLTHDFYAGNEPGFPDYMIFPFFERLWLLAKSGMVKIDLDNFPGAEYPKLHKWFNAMMQRPETKAAMQPPEVSLQYINDHLVNGKPNYDLNLKDD
ncbi:hypothetical protein WR25_06126 [Diploscapter pachys]|uniref:Glutathione-dependent dehydroascorbate reductase n=1 Tax=Diploscapter pachys TaxID=2018661 RepID=A0A2A2LDD5_9BILA|nr:hypothetical protein WR25_06126 [Diploscapter pachys]